MARQSLGTVRSAALRKNVLKLLKGISMGLRSGEYCGRSKGRSRTLDGFPHAWRLVSTEVVHHNDIVAFERRNQELLDIGKEHFSVHGTLDYERCNHSIVPQRCHEGDRLPMSVRHATNQPHATRAAPLEPRHIGADCSLIDKHQSGGVKHALLPDPAPTRPRHVSALLLRRSHTFF